MNVLVDTSVWSLALRRKQQTSHPAVDQLRDIIKEWNSYRRISGGKKT
jgi:predicted nucleic acid-binding protein